MLGRVADHEAELPARCRNVADPDGGLAAAKLGRDGVFHRLQPLLGGVGDIGFQQELAATGDVEAQVDPRVRYPARPAFDLAFREQAGDCQQDAGQHDQADRPDFQLGKVEH